MRTTLVLTLFAGCYRVPPPPPPPERPPPPPVHRTHDLPSAAPVDARWSSQGSMALLRDGAAGWTLASWGSPSTSLQITAPPQSVAVIDATLDAWVAWTEQGALVTQRFTGEATTLPTQACPPESADSCTVHPLVLHAGVHNTWVGGWSQRDNDSAPRGWLAAASNGQLVQEHELSVTDDAATAVTSLAQGGNILWIAGRTQPNNLEQASPWVGTITGEGPQTTVLPGVYPTLSPLALHGKGDRVWVVVPSDTDRTKLYLHVRSASLAPENVIEIVLPAPRIRTTPTHLTHLDDRLAISVLLEGPEPAALTLLRSQDGTQAFPHDVQSVGRDFRPDGIRLLDDGRRLVWGRRLTVQGRTTCIRELPTLGSGAAPPQAP